ncbi:MAG: AAA family ATPase [Candidatus Polarisedimenticolia bacterium]
MSHAAIEQRILDRLDGAVPSGSLPLVFVTGPRGSGRSRLLGRLAGRLAARGVLPVPLDVERVGASPQEFACAMRDGLARAVALAGRPPLPHDGEPGRLQAALEALLAGERVDACRLLEVALALPHAVAQHITKPIALVLDELGELLPLSRHAGLRGLEDLLARSFAAGRRVGLIASVSPASRAGSLLRRCEAAAAGGGRPFESIPLPPWSRDEVAAFFLSRAGHPLTGELDLWMRATGGHPLHVEVLLRRFLEGPASLVETLAAEMTPPAGALHLECRFDYHLLVERSRGHAAVRTVLHLIACNEHVTLTDVARHVRTALPTAMDYLSWMMEVGLIRRDGRWYRMADPLLGLWVRLNGPDTPAPLEEAARFLGASPVARTSSILLPPESLPEPAPLSRGDFPMEID